MKKQATRLIGCILFLCILLASPLFSARRESVPVLRVTYLSVGQGDSIMLQTGEKTILIDAGNDLENAAKASIIPFCKKEGIKKIDTCIITHPHRDHFGGFIDLIQVIPVGEFLYSTDKLGSGDAEEGGNDAVAYQKLYDLIKEKNIPYVQAKINGTYNWGKGLKVELLHEAEGIFAVVGPAPVILNGNVEVDPRLGSDTPKVSANNQSLIFKITVGDITFLFTGDAEKEAEATTMKMFGDKLHCTVLKAGHHGSKTSSSAPFMEKVSPDYGVISVGKYNSFKHPSPETLETYNYYKMKVFRTDQDGTVDCYTDGKTVRFNSNQSPLEFTSKPEIISLTANSATLQWKTNKTSTTQIGYGTSAPSEIKLLESGVTLHTMTLTGLKAQTKYVFQAFSQDARQPEQTVTFDGTFTTPAGDGVPLPRIQTLLTNYEKIYAFKEFQVRTSIANPGKTKTTGLSLELYHSAMSEDMKLGRKDNLTVNPNGHTEVSFPVTITWIGPLDLIAVLKKDGKIIDTGTLSIHVYSKILLVDAAHGNIDYYVGKFAGMKMDLSQKLGFEMKSISKPLNFDYIKDAFIVAIPDPEKEFTVEELSAVKQFVTKGGSILLFSRSDYGNRGHPQILNGILQAAGSNIRFNDDEFCDPTNNIGPPWKAFIRVFPSPIIQGVQQLLFQNPCSLLNAKMQGLKASKNLHLFATGDEDCFNVDGDSLGDAYFYGSQTVKLPIPVVAGEDLGVGRVVCMGEPLYDDKLYSANSQLQTPQFNRVIVEWMSRAREKTLKQIVAYIADLESEKDPEIVAMRYEELKNLVVDGVKQFVESGFDDEVKDAFDGSQGNAVLRLKSDVRETLRFRSLHGESNKAVDHLLQGF